MATITAENILHLIEQMPPNEQLKLKLLMEHRNAIAIRSRERDNTTSSQTVASKTNT